MKEVEHFTFMLPPDIWRKKEGPSTFKMAIEEAASRHPGATPIRSTREIRQLPETAAAHAERAKYFCGHTKGGPTSKGNLPQLETSPKPASGRQRQLRHEPD